MMEKKHTLVKNIHGDKVTCEIIRSSKRKKSVSMKYHDNKVVVRAPMRTDKAFIEQWINKKKSWITKMIEKHQHFAKHTWFNKDQWILKCFWKSIPHKQWSSALPFDLKNNATEKTVVRKYKAYAKQFLTTRTYELLEAKKDLVSEKTFSQKMQKFLLGKQFHVNKVRIYTYRRKYGQCKGKVISYDWRILALPREIIDHIILHELTHLVHRHHKKSFWNLLEKFDENCKKHRQWLKNHGGAIHC